MAQTVADYLLQRLREWDVEHVFGYAGDGINGLLASFDKAGNKPQFLQARHEEMAGFEACGYAKFSGGFAVCAATSGPGAIHLLNGLYDAKLDHVPVVAIVGQQGQTSLGGSYQQEVDLHALYKDVASDFLVEVNTPVQLPNALDRAIRTSLTYRTTTALIIPGDVQEAEYQPPTHAFKMIPSSPPGIRQPQVMPSDDDLSAAADVINAGHKVAILIGQGARPAAAEVRQLADLTGAGVAKAMLGKDVLSDELEYVTGAIGLLGTRPSYEMMRDCDTLVMIGSNFPYSQFLPPFDQARGVEIDIDGRFIGMRYPTEVNLVGDSHVTLQGLLGKIDRKQDRSWRETIESNVAGWWQTVDREAGVEATPINPMRIISELSSRIPENAIITADSGSSTNWYARNLRMRDGMRSSLSGTLATMGPGVPYAIGAKFAHPDRPAIAIVGDGAMQMNGMAELITIKRYYQQWDDPRCIICVFHNDDLAQVTWELRAMAGSPKFVESQMLPDVNYAQFAESLGLQSVAVDDPGQIGSAWDTALAASRPTVLDIKCDPDVPPIPPHATYQQMKDTAESMLKGDPDALHVVMEGAKTKLQEFVPGRKQS